MEDILDNQYTRVTHWQNVVNASMVFAVIIAVLGLFGITGLQAINRTKEIGIRKVLGADIKDVIYLINKKIMWIAVLSFLIAIPLSIFASQKWLDNFAYRIELSLTLFITAASISLFIAGLTVAFHSIRAALTNPVDTLKVE
jgi:putative ABC transport system permease protein